MARKPIKKSVRFEVFKRDSFTCQYCGRQAPEAVLHIDHIKPVAKGGKNEIINLVTSCDQCNLGKGARELSDDSVVMKQKEQLDELNERREQLEMMMQWRDGMEDLMEKEVDVVNSVMAEHGKELTDFGRKNVKRMIKKYGLNEVIESIEISFEKNKSDAVDYAERICKVRESQKSDPMLKDKMYIRGILRNRIRYGFDSEKIIQTLNRYCKSDMDVEVIRDIAKCVDSTDAFVLEVYELYRGK